MEKVAWISGIIVACLMIADRIELRVRARTAWREFRDWYHREKVPTRCALCQKNGERRYLPGPSDLLIVYYHRGSIPWAYRLARGEKVVRGATGSRYGMTYPFRAEIEHRSCRLLRWLEQRISDAGFNLLK